MLPTLSPALQQAVAIVLASAILAGAGASITAVVLLWRLDRTVFGTDQRPGLVERVDAVEEQSTRNAYALRCADLRTDGGPAGGERCDG